ncbi:MAG: VanZ family protein [Candidatus Aenigmarchaeota archaeon]|nr:VanZ family protein [Candidatus Aenigmarchaeota archaeon]
MHTLLKAMILLETIFLIAFSILPATVVPPTGLPSASGISIEHLLAYLIYGILLTLAFRSRKSVLLAGVGMSLFTESIQLFAPTRFFDPLDLFANILGIAVGAGLVCLLLRIQNKPNRFFLSWR